jgi:hypothetical protein
MLRWFARIGSAFKKGIPEPERPESSTATHGSAENAPQTVPAATSPDAAPPIPSASPPAALAAGEQIAEAAEIQDASPVATDTADAQIAEAAEIQDASPVATDTTDAQIAEAAAIQDASPVASDAADARTAQVARDPDAALIAPDRQEVLRRRELVRTFFNDFWSGRDDKPATFQERLDQAETYLNERLVALGESWRLDDDARKMLSLPSRSGPGARDTSATS